MFNQIFLIHIFFTMAFFSLKVIFIGIYILYPRIAKRIVDFHNIMNHDKKNLEY
jgi:hypothetical protein